MAIEYVLQSRAGPFGIERAECGCQPVGQDQAVRDELAGGRKSFVEARVALLILERENDRERRTDNRQDRRRDRQKIPVRELKERGDQQRPQEEVERFPSRPDEEFGELIPATCMHESNSLGQSRTRLLRRDDHSAKQSINVAAFALARFRDASH